jgi:tRNA-dihydrouridine synthase A
MEKVDDLLPDMEHSLDKRIGEEGNLTNLILQLGSNNANKLKTCVRVVSDRYPDLREINLNCGCPAIDTGGATTYGATLMKDTPLTSQLIQSIASATDIPVSVKCRIAVFDTAQDVVPLGEKHYEYLYEYVTAIHDAGARHVILHARPAILSLTPVKNRIVPSLDYGIVNRIASDFQGKVKITINGGINSLTELKAMQNDDTTNIDSHMSGRWCLRRPLDLMEIERSLVDDAMPDAQSAINQYIEYAVRNQNHFTMGELCLPLYLIVSQLQGDYEQQSENNLLSWRK